MTYQVLARKWRPRTFKTMVGQTHVLRALVNALNQNRLHHAYLFTGTRGVGKTTIARVLAKCLNCEQGVSAIPCDQCSACRAINQGSFVDLIEIDAASRTKVEDIRELLDNVQYTPTVGRFKIYLIDEVHMLSGHSFNALLKTLEEPPPHVKFLLATTDPQKLPITVLSRCLQFHLKNLPPELIEAHLHFILTQENINFEQEALRHLARAASGSMRDALSLLDQAIAYGNVSVLTTDVRTMLGTLETTHLINLLMALRDKQANAILEIIQQLAEQAVDFGQVLEELLSVLHQIAVIQAVPTVAIEQWDQSEALQKLASSISKEDIQLYYQIGLVGRRDIGLAPTAKTGFEMILLRMLAFQPQVVKTGTRATSSATTPEIKKTEPDSGIRNNDTVSHGNNIINSENNSSKNTNNSDWHTLLLQLNLNGLTRALANHCQLLRITDTEAHLVLEPNQAPLLNDKQCAYLSQAFSEFYGRPIKAQIQISTPQHATPAAIKKQQQAERQASAEKTITDDKNIQALINTFNATLTDVSENKS